LFEKGRSPPRKSVGTGVSEKEPLTIGLRKSVRTIPVWEEIGMTEPLVDRVIQGIGQATDLYHHLIILVAPAGSGKTFR